MQCRDRAYKLMESLRKQPFNVEAETRLAALLQTLARSFQRISLIKEVLVELPSFDPYNAFRMLDRDHKGWVGATDLREFLMYFSVLAHTHDIGNSTSRPRWTTSSASYAPTTRTSMRGSTSTILCDW